jgi:UDP-hydrolysing UDP-N-acetyl-D-glucosamine 2-epimerase
MQKNKRINITFFSANRAEYGLIYPFIKKLSANKKFNINLIVAGSHLEKKFGNTFNEIKKDKIKILAKIKIPIKTNNLLGTARYFNEIQKKINIALDKSKTDLVFLSSDRFETFAFAITSYLRKIPIIHYEGGDITEGGALDDNIRHAITKISNLHITSNHFSYKRIIKMGEEKWRCINVGYSALNNINLKNFNYAKIQSKYNLNSTNPVILFTLHPLILEKNQFLKELNESFKSLENLNKLGYQIILTYPNFDPGYQKIINKIKFLKNKFKNIKVYKHLGRENYHQILYYIGKSNNGACVGNSSSGIKEAVIFKSPAINIGERQKSRLKPNNVFNVMAVSKQITKKIQNNLSLKNKMIKNPYKLTNNFINLDKKILKIFNNKSFTKKKCTY